MVYAKLTSYLLNNHIITMAPAWWMQIDTDAYIIAMYILHFPCAASGQCERHECHMTNTFRAPVTPMLAVL